MTPWDARLFAAVYGGPQGGWRSAMIALTLIGGGWATLLLLPIACWQPARRPAATLAMAIAVQATLVWLLKLEIGRVRPWIAMDLSPPPGAPQDGSFPSGHASGSFCVAAFLAIWLSGSRLQRTSKAAVGMAVFVLAALVSMSRIYLGAHYPSDVIAGAGLGALVGACAGKYHSGRHTTSIR